MKSAAGSALFMIFLAAVAGSTAGSQEAVYRSGKVERVIADEMLGVRPAQPSPQTERTANSVVASESHGTVYVLIIRSGESVFAAQLPEDLPQGYLSSLKPGTSIRFRISGKNLYVNSAATREMQTLLLETNPAVLRRK